MTQTITQDTPFTEADDQYHPLSDNPLDLETNWWSINIPQRRIGIWLHAAYYPNGCLLYTSPSPRDS